MTEHRSEPRPEPGPSPRPAPRPELRPTRRELRRRGWHEWRAAVPGFLTPRRRGALALATALSGTAAAVGIDRLLSGAEDLDWAGALRVVGSASFGSAAAAVAVMVVVLVSLRRDRLLLAPVSWRDDRLVVDYSSPGAPELSATLAPRLLASARKQRLGLVGTLTMGLGSAAAFAVGLIGAVGVAVAAGAPGLGFAGVALSALSFPFTTAASLEALGRAGVAIDLAEAHLTRAHLTGIELPGDAASPPST